jgi:formylglycine-generating enzyme
MMQIRSAKRAAWRASLLSTCLAVMVFGCGDDDGAPGPTTKASCAQLPSTCGASGAEDCCLSAVVPGGMYLREHDKALDGLHASMDYPASVNDFQLDTYEITVGRFRAFLETGGGSLHAPPAEGAGAHPNLPGSGWKPGWDYQLEVSPAEVKRGLLCMGFFSTPVLATWTDDPGANENRPINCITWYEAFAFCAWDGGFLPTELQWNYAATGGDEQRAYPWSVPAESLTLDASHASYSEDGMTCYGDGIPTCTVSDFVLVGSKPAGNGRWGHADLAGNASEWVLDWVGDYPATCIDCANLMPPEVDQWRMQRGGGIATTPRGLRTGNRRRVDDPTGGYQAAPPHHRWHTVGARCARPI